MKYYTIEEVSKLMEEAYEFEFLGYGHILPDSSLPEEYKKKRDVNERSSEIFIRKGSI